MVLLGVVVFEVVGAVLALGFEFGGGGGEGLRAGPLIRHLQILKPRIIWLRSPDLFLWVQLLRVPLIC